MLTARKNQSQILILLGSATFAALLYLPAIHSAFQFDDYRQIARDYGIRNLWDISRIWASSQTRFLTHLTFALNYHFGRLNVSGYHVVNLGLHFCTGFFLFLWVHRIFETPQMKAKSTPEQTRLIALFTSLLFLCHPVQTQAVNYIVQRSALLAALFYFAALILYHEFRNTSKKSYYVAGIAVTWLSMLTKPNAWILPFAILLYEMAFWESWALTWKKRLISLAPFFLSTAVIPILYASNVFIHLKDTRLLTRADLTIPRLHYFLTEWNVLRTYLRLFFWPFGLNLDYDYPVARSVFEASTFASGILLLALFFLAFRLYSRYRLPAFGILWFFLTLSMESSFIPLPDVIFEHRMYLPMAGLCLAVSYGLAFVLQHEKKFLKVGVLILAVCSFMTYQRNLVWQDTIRLWRDVVQKSPNKPRAYNNLATQYEVAKQWDQARLYFEKAIQKDPAYAQAYFGLGNVDYEQGNYEKAIEAYRKLIEMRGADAEVLTALGANYNKLGKYPEAIQYFQQALKLKDPYPAMYNNLGFALDALGDLDGAIQNFQQAVRWDPAYAEAYNNMGVSYGKKGDLENLVRYCLKAVQLKPDYASPYSNLGFAYDKQGNLAGAEAAYLKAIELNPDFAQAYNNLGVIYLKKGDKDKAVAQFEKAAALSPEYADAKRNLEVVKKI